MNKQIATNLIAAAADLDELLEALKEVYAGAERQRELAASCLGGDEHACANEWVDFSSLPTFGGSDLAGEQIWSWDADRVLVGESVPDFEIVERSEVDWAQTY